MNSLKSLLPSIVLIAVYFIADEFFGPVAGTLTALVLGVTEFVYTRIREKISDKMILWTTLFFCLPGLLVILAPASPLARLQPAVIETALCILLGIFAFTHTDLTATLPAGYRKNIHFTPAQLKDMKHTLQVLFYLLCTHTLISYAALLFLPGAKAAFISGPLLYILLGSYFVSTFLRNRILWAKRKKEEWLPLVNEQGQITGKAPRSICHSGSKLLHPVVHLHILNPQQHIFLQKRSLKKDLLPGKWDTAVGGHIGLNETAEAALKREAAEELGITGFEARFLGLYIWESPREKELVYSFICTRYNQIHIDNDEVDEGRFWSPQEIEEGIRREWITPNFAHEYKLLLGKIKTKNLSSNPEPAKPRG